MKRCHPAHGSSAQGSAWQEVAPATCPCPSEAFEGPAWVNQTTPGAFLLKRPVEELSKAFPNVLGGSEHPNIGASGCPDPEPCPEFFPWLRERHQAWSTSEEGQPSQATFPGAPIPSLSSGCSPTSFFLKHSTRCRVWGCFGFTRAEPGRG